MTAAEQIPIRPLVDEFSTAAIAAAIGFMSCKADEVMGRPYFVPKAVDALYRGGLTFKYLVELEAEIKERCGATGANLSNFLAARVLWASIERMNL